MPDFGIFNDAPAVASASPAPPLPQLRPSLGVFDDATDAPSAPQAAPQAPQPSAVPAPELGLFASAPPATPQSGVQQPTENPISNIMSGFHQGTEQLSTAVHLTIPVLKYQL